MERAEEGAGALSYEQVVALISQVGFPIVVSGYLLFRMERTLKELVSKIERMVGIIERLCPPKA